MKKILIITFAVLAVACSSRELNEIEQVAKDYLDAMGNYRIDDAAPYATRFTREHTIPIFNAVMARTDTNYINSNRPATITIHGSRMITDTTARVYYHKSTPIKEVDDSVTLLLEEGRWLVDLRVSMPPILTLKADTLSSELPKNLPKATRRIPADSVKYYLEKQNKRRLK